MRRSSHRSRWGRLSRRASPGSRLRYGITRAPSRSRWGRRLAALAATLALVAALSVATLGSSPGQPQLLTPNPTPTTSTPAHPRAATPPPAPPPPPPLPPPPPRHLP